MAADREVVVFHSNRLGQYGFGHGHPFSTERLGAFMSTMARSGLSAKVAWTEPGVADRSAIQRFHDGAYIDRVISHSRLGDGYLDYGDTPAFPDVYAIASTVVGATLQALAAIMSGPVRRAFVPIAGLHHARRTGAAGFCVFNDCAIAIEYMKAHHPAVRIAYVDIDAHHGDGVFYSYEDDPGLGFVDLHEDGKHLYPGTGAVEETGAGRARGTKLNIPMPPGSGDEAFFRAWSRAEEYLEEFKPGLIMLQCGADSVAGDPLTHLRYSPKAHEHATERLCKLATRFGDGRVLALGGGGYNLTNIGAAWSKVVGALLSAP